MIYCENCKGKMISDLACPYGVLTIIKNSFVLMHLGGIFLQSNPNFIQIKYLYLAGRRCNVRISPYPKIEIINSICKNKAHDLTFEMPMHLRKLQQAMRSFEGKKFLWIAKSSEKLLNRVFNIWRVLSLKKIREFDSRKKKEK